MHALASICSVCKELTDAVLGFILCLIWAWPSCKSRGKNLKDLLDSSFIPYVKSCPPDWNFCSLKYSEILANMEDFQNMSSYSVVQLSHKLLPLLLCLCFIPFSLSFPLLLLSLLVVILATFLCPLLFSNFDLIFPLKEEKRAKGWLFTLAAGSAK